MYFSKSIQSDRLNPKLAIVENQGFDSKNKWNSLAFGKLDECSSNRRTNTNFEQCSYGEIFLKNRNVSILEARTILEPIA